MSTTEMRVKGYDLKKMTDLEMRFCLFYVTCWVGSEAVRKAGYKTKNPDVMAVAILKRPHIKAYIGKIKREDCEKFQIQRYEVIWHLNACATRNIRDLLDENGEYCGNLKSLSSEVTASVDGFRQTKRTYHREDGSEVVEMREVINEIKPVDKAKCMDMAMKHLGEYAAEQVQHQMGVNWDEYYFPPEKTIEVE